MRKYRAIDLTVWAAVMCLSEAAAHFALMAFPTEVFTFSVVLPVTLIAMMRWGWRGAPHAVLGGLVYSLLNGGGRAAVLAYTLGNAFAAVNLLWFTAIDKRRIRESALLTIAYALTGYTLMTLGRAAVASAIESAPFTGLFVRFASTDALSLVMAFIILLIARREDKNGCVLQDQTEYLSQLAEREQSAQKAAK